MANNESHTRKIKLLTSKEMQRAIEELKTQLTPEDKIFFEEYFKLSQTEYSNDEIADKYLYSRANALRQRLYGIYDNIVDEKNAQKPEKTTLVARIKAKNSHRTLPDIDTEQGQKTLLILKDILTAKAYEFLVKYFGLDGNPQLTTQEFASMAGQKVPSVLTYACNLKKKYIDILNNGANYPEKHKRRQQSKISKLGDTTSPQAIEALKKLQQLSSPENWEIFVKFYGLFGNQTHLATELTQQYNKQAGAIAQDMRHRYLDLLAGKFVSNTNFSVAFGKLGISHNPEQLNKYLKILQENTFKRYYEIFCKANGVGGFARCAQVDIAKEYGITTVYVSTINKRMIAQLADIANGNYESKVNKKPTDLVHIMIEGDAKRSRRILPRANESDVRAQFDQIKQIVGEKKWQIFNTFYGIDCEPLPFKMLTEQFNMDEDAIRRNVKAVRQIYNASLEGRLSEEYQKSIEKKKYLKTLGDTSSPEAKHALDVLFSHISERDITVMKKYYDIDHTGYVSIEDLASELGMTTSNIYNLTSRYKNCYQRLLAGEDEKQIFPKRGPKPVQKPEKPKTLIAKMTDKHERKSTEQPKAQKPTTRADKPTSKYYKPPVHKVTAITPEDASIFAQKRRASLGDLEDAQVKEALALLRDSLTAKKWQMFTEYYSLSETPLDIDEICKKYDLDMNNATKILHSCKCKYLHFRKIQSQSDQLKSGGFDDVDYSNDSPYGNSNSRDNISSLISDMIGDRDDQEDIPYLSTNDKVREQQEDESKPRYIRCSRDMALAIMKDDCKSDPRKWGIYAHFLGIDGKKKMNIENIAIKYDLSVDTVKFVLIDMSKKYKELTGQQPATRTYY